MLGVDVRRGGKEAALVALLAAIEVNMTEPEALEIEEPAEEPKRKLDPEYAVFNCRAELWYCLTALFTLAVLSMMLIATLLQDWSYILLNGEDRNYALFTCRNCPDGIQDGSWDCLMQEQCSIRPAPGLCETAKGMHEAGGVFLALELFGMLTTLLIMERLAYLTFRKAYGWSGSMYCLSASMFALQVAAVGGWFGVSGAEFSANCSTEPETVDEPWQVCAESAPAIAVANLILAAFAGLFICVVVAARHKKADLPDNIENVGRHHFLCWENRYVMLCVFLTLLSHLVLFIASLGVKEWSKVNGESGSLIHTKHWGNINDYGYDCIEARACDIDDDSGVCKTFSDLYEAGWGYTGLEIGALFFWVLWMEPTFYQVSGKDFGIPALNYTWPFLCFVCHFTATVMWFRVSEATWETDCDYLPSDSTDKFSICATKGPAIALANLCLFFFTIPLWAWVYYNRTIYAPTLKSKEIPEDDED